MRCGVSLYLQAHQDWDRYLAFERGEKVPPLDPGLDHQTVTSELDLAIEAEELGFDSLWAIEHHCTPYGMSPNPLQMLAYLAGATKRVDVGTQVVVVPWNQPLRVAEQITMLQYALRGRTPYIGFGRGAARREFQQMDINKSESAGRFHEGVEVIKLAITQDVFSYHGEHYHFDNVTMRPRPLDPQALLDAMHFAWGSPTSPPIGAKLGLKPLIVPQRAWSAYRPELATFDAARREAGYASARPRIHMIAYVGETARQAEEGAAKHVAEYAVSAINHYELTGSHFARTKGYEHYAKMAPHYTAQSIIDSYVNNHAWGTPDVVLKKIQSIAEAFHPEEFTFVFRYGSMTHEQGERNLRLFAREVLPALHELKVQEPLEFAAGEAAGDFSWQFGPDAEKAVKAGQGS